MYAAIEDFPFMVECESGYNQTQSFWGSVCCAAHLVRLFLQHPTSLLFHEGELENSETLTSTKCCRNTQVVLHAEWTGDLEQHSFPGLSPRLGPMDDTVGGEIRFLLCCMTITAPKHVSCSGNRTVSKHASMILFCKKKQMCYYISTAVWICWSCNLQSRYDQNQLASTLGPKPIFPSCWMPSLPMVLKHLYLVTSFDKFIIN